MDVKLAYLAGIVEQLHNLKRNPLSKSVETKRFASHEDGVIVRTDRQLSEEVETTSRLN